MEITKFGLQNFRVFKEYFEFELAPIMVLTGPNSSGKSSLSKALMLLKANEYELNMNVHLGIKLNYFKGEHDLGNHIMNVNDKEKNSFYSLTFFEDYKLVLEVGKSGELINDYSIRDENNEMVITQFGAIIHIDVLRFIKYLRRRIKYFKNMNYKHDHEKIMLFIEKMSDFNSSHQIFKIESTPKSDLCF